jgi:hypothetical protein
LFLILKAATKLWDRPNALFGIDIDDSGLKSGRGLAVAEKSEAQFDQQLGYSYN